MGVGPPIAERLLAVDGPDEGVRHALKAIYVVFALDDVAAAALGRVLAVLHRVGPCGMTGLVHEGVAVEALHDVDFAAVGPLRVLWEHPEGGPCPLLVLEARADFDLAVGEEELVLAPNAASEEGTVIGLEVVVDDAHQDEVPVLYLHEVVAQGHVFVPRGFSGTGDARPYAFVERVAVEFIMPKK